jgi:cell division protein FtsQ
VTIDPRLLERRKDVAEDKAQRSMRRLVRFLIVILTLGALVWLALSPWLSVSRVRTAGIVSSDAHATLAREDLVAGTPMIFVRTGDIEEALEKDPWVEDARVTHDWPDEVLVRVTERVPVLWVESSQGWTWRATDGVAVPGPERPDPASPSLIVSNLTESDLDDSQLVPGAARFVASLPTELQTDLTMTLEEGELWAEVGGFAVRLGRPIEMEAKALSLTALLRENIPEGSTLILVAPTNPSVDMPDTQQPEDPAEEGGAEDDESAAP